MQFFEEINFRLFTPFAKISATKVLKEMYQHFGMLMFESKIYNEAVLDEVSLA